ncbi:hypothetical protein D3C71_1324640 [compost metagenome]
MENHHIDEFCALILVALGSDDDILIVADLANPWHELTGLGAIARLPPAGFHGNRFALTPSTDWIDDQDREQAEQEGADNEREDELPDGNTGCSRDYQFVAAVQRDQHGHADEEAECRYRLLQDERQAHERNAQGAENTVLGKARKLARRLAEIGEHDDRTHPQKEPEGGHDIPLEEISTKRGEDHDAPPPELDDIFRRRISMLFMRPMFRVMVRGMWSCRLVASI